MLKLKARIRATKRKIRREKAIKSLPKVKTTAKLSRNSKLSTALRRLRNAPLSMPSSSWRPTRASSIASRMTR